MIRVLILIYTITIHQPNMAIMEITYTYFYLLSFLALLAIAKGETLPELDAFGHESPNRLSGGLGSRSDSTLRPMVPLQISPYRISGPGRGRSLVTRQAVTCKDPTARM